LDESGNSGNQHELPKSLQSSTLFAFAESRKQNVSIELARVKRILF